MNEQQIPSRQTLDEVPKRVFTFVIALVEVPVIATLLASKGYTDADHAYAWERLTRLAVTQKPPTLPILDRTIRDAVIELDDWDEPHFACIKAALERLYPDQAAYVFRDLEPKQGPEAVIGVGTLLDRLDDLENSPDRVATRAADHDALAMLAQRGYPPEERRRLRNLIDSTRTITPLVPVNGREREQILLELYAWFTDWSMTAKTVITRRDHLIRLGFAKRRKSKSESGASTGGASTGGVSNGSVSTGGASTGGVSTGSASNGSASNGSVSNGGTSNGVVSTGSASNGGASNGGASNGGVSNGTISTGGVPTGGGSTSCVSTGGSATGGSATGGSAIAGGN